MKKNRPGKIVICGKSFKIKYDKARADANCCLDNALMVIGTAIEANVQENLVHEALEMALLLHGLRFEKYSDTNDGLRFVFDHAGFELWIKEVTLILEQLK